jgi:cystathionine beta-lyase
MSRKTGLNRRDFIKSAGVTAIAGATATVANQASAQSASDSYPRLANGKYDFDTVYNRVGSNCSRWDSPPRSYPNGEFQYGMGVASMDFECAPCITEALQERVAHHSWGYLSTTQPLRDEIVKWTGEHHGVDLGPDEITLSDGVYPGVIAAMRAFVPIGNKVLVPSPAYSGFYSMARAANIETVDSQMKRVNGRYEFDFDDLEAKMTPDVRAVILCNPQNPTGNVWQEEELLRLGRLALEHNVLVISDEIHCDVVRSGHKIVPFASLSDRAVVNNSITMTAISKTFNLAGMKCAHYYSKNPTVLARVNQFHRAEISTLGVAATEAAYKHGREWFEQANAYMDSTHTMIENHIKQKMPSVTYTRNEGTYMTFLDFSKVMAAIGAEEQAKAHGKRSPEHYLQDWMVYNSGVYLNPGSLYGAGGEGHMRMNIASSQQVIADVLDAMASAVNKVV